MDLSKSQVYKILQSEVFIAPLLLIRKIFQNQYME